MFYKKTIEKISIGQSRTYDWCDKLEKQIDVLENQIDYLLKQRELLVKVMNQSVNKIKELEENFLKNTKTLLQMEKAIKPVKTTKKASKKICINS